MKGDTSFGNFKSTQTTPIPLIVKYDNHHRLLTNILFQKTVMCESCNTFPELCNTYVLKVPDLYTINNNTIITNYNGW
jgi:hypothetical protein